ncbi:thioredoxin [Ancylothrix sp. C2]|uniref:thioredoxin family protein n=1 Tax=Ancylothrix sp. D3o TaxID=2953691 RepID=UPI0021BA6F38|nr:thioredoxin family protein [Ancylothrix sp. D3o]MCT7948365.1 thioredoxin [Ancylothrix sp. D3o]
MSSSVLVINDGEFQTEVVNATKPVLVYFWADWCGPCRLVSPSINWVAETYGDRLKVVKMEVDPNPNSVKEYQIEGVPALRLLKGNQVILSYEGAITKQKLADLIEPLL